MSYTGAVCGKAIAGLAVCGTDPQETAQDFAGYQLRYGDYILYDPRGANETDRLCASAASVDLTAGKAGSMAFTLPPDHPYRDKLPYMRPGLELLQGRYVVWRGRITSQVGDFRNSLNVTAEGVMAVLNDSTVPPFVYPDDFAEDAGYQAAANNGNVVDFLFRWFLAQHNAKVSADQQIKPGACTVTDANNYIARSATKYLTTMEAMTTRLTGSALGGYLLMRYEADGNYLDYYADLPLTNAQAVQFGQNLLDLHHLHRHRLLHPDQQAGGFRRQGHLHPHGAGRRRPDGRPGQGGPIRLVPSRCGKVRLDLSRSNGLAGRHCSRKPPVLRSGPAGYLRLGAG